MSLVIQGAAGGRRGKPPFRPLLEIATTRPDSDVEMYVLEKEAPAVWGEQQVLSGPCF